MGHIWWSKTTRAMVGNIWEARQSIWGARVSMAGLVEDTNAACHLGQGSRRAYLHSYLYPRGPNPLYYLTCITWEEDSAVYVHWLVIYRGRLHGPSGVPPIYQSRHTVDSSTRISHIHKRISWFLLFDSCQTYFCNYFFSNFSVCINYGVIYLWHVL